METRESFTEYNTHTHTYTHTHYISHTFTDNPAIQEAGLYQIQKEAPGEQK